MRRRSVQDVTVIRKLLIALAKSANSLWHGMRDCAVNPSHRPMPTDSAETHFELSWMTMKHAQNLPNTSLSVAVRRLRQRSQFTAFRRIW
jgi:hypothetical protein